MDAVEYLLSEGLDRVRVEAIDRLVAHLCSLTEEECIAKYRKGRKEHNQDLEAIATEKELREEAMDIVNYAAISMLQKHQ